MQIEASVIDYVRPEYTVCQAVLFPAAAQPRSPLREMLEAQYPLASLLRTRWCAARAAVRLAAETLLSVWSYCTQDWQWGLTNAYSEAREASFTLIYQFRSRAR